MAGRKGGVWDKHTVRHREGQEHSERPHRHSDSAGAGDDRGELMGGRTMTDEEWRTYLRREIERLLAAANDRTLNLTAMFLRRLTKQ